MNEDLENTDQITDVPETILPEPQHSLSTPAPTLAPSLVYLVTAALVFGTLFLIYYFVKDIQLSVVVQNVEKSVNEFLDQPVYSSTQQTQNQVVSSEEKARILNDSGWTVLETGDLVEAERLLKESIQLDPTFALPYNNLGIVYHRKGEMEQAKEYYEKSVAADPMYPKPVHNIGSIHKDQGEYALAVEYYTKAIEIDNTWSAPYKEVGEIYMYQGRVNMGLDAYERAVTLDDPSSARLKQILQNLVDIDEIVVSYDIVPPGNMIRLQSDISGPAEGLAKNQAQFVYGEKVSTESPDTVRTFYVDVTDNSFTGPRHHYELFGSQGDNMAAGYEFYGLPADSSVVEEEKIDIDIDGLPATYTRFSSPEQPDWHGEAVVIKIDRYEYFIHNGGKKDERFEEFYKSFTYRSGLEESMTDYEQEVQTVVLDDGNELKLFANRKIEEQKSTLQEVEGCLIPEFQSADLVLELGEQKFELTSFGVPKKRGGEWQVVPMLINLGLADKEYEFVWSPLTKLGSNTFLIPNYKTYEVSTHKMGLTEYCDVKFEYEVFYYNQGKLERDSRHPKQTYNLSRLIIDRDREIEPFCFNGCG